MLDRDKTYTAVFGRKPLRYLQGGHGFDAAGNDLGRYDDQGEPVKAPELPPETHIDVEPDDDRDSEGLGELSEMTVLELRALAKSRDIPTVGRNKAALIEALEG